MSDIFKQDQGDVGSPTGTRKPWTAPQIISSEASETASNQLPTFFESTVPTDRPS